MSHPETIVEGGGALATRVENRTGTRPQLPSVLGWVRARAATTPGRLVLISLLVVAGAITFGAIATAAERSRAQAAQAAQSQTEPLLASAVRLYTSLSDANATVTTTLLHGGLETPAERLRYELDLQAASRALATLTREAGSSPAARGALGVISQAFPVYSGLIESARANDRQGYPVGAAYLRQASALLTGPMLHAADRLYVAEARRLGDDYGTGTASGALVAFTIAVVTSLVLLLLAQRYVARISRRTFNLPMVGATAVLLALAVWGTVGLLNEQSGLTTARRDGSDSVEILSATRVLLSRAQGDQSLALVNRGSDASDALDFTAVMQMLTGPHGTGGLAAERSALAARTGARGVASRFAAEFATYNAETTEISRLQNEGLITEAIARAPAAADTSDLLAKNLSAQLTGAQRSFTRSASEATSSLSGLSIAIPLLTTLAAVLALLGLRERINEYR